MLHLPVGMLQRNAKHNVHQYITHPRPNYFPFKPKNMRN